MNEYQFILSVTNNGETLDCKHTLFAKSFSQAYKQLLKELPHNYDYTYVFVSPLYIVNGKRRFSK